MTTESAPVLADQEDPPRRAQPLSIDDRQAMIIDAVIPLLIEHGRAVTSKQIAEAAGIAEGTIFRAFGDKDSLVAAAVQRYLDPEPLRTNLRAIDPALPLVTKVELVVHLMRERFGGLFQMMAAVGRAERPRAGAARAEFEGIIVTVLGPELADLNWPPESIARIIRLITFASTFPPLNQGAEFSDTELAAIILYGLAGQPASDPRSASASTK